MKIGLLRQNTLITCPSAMGVRSTSIGAPAAIVEASGFICAMSGQSAPTAPTAATTPVAMKRKSRRLGSAEDIVVTRNLYPVPQFARSRSAPRTRAQAVQRRSIGTLANGVQVGRY